MNQIEQKIEIELVVTGIAKRDRKSKRHFLVLDVVPDVENCEPSLEHHAKAVETLKTFKSVTQAYLHTCHIKLENDHGLQIRSMEIPDRRARRFEISGYAPKAGV